ncbi:DegT/DnrJ/EryC1/StrS family aminotransferase [Pseudorhodoplanes sp.]|uniref:DegT/DnrJ/EryC1/StrS family aminotransferase n=1 Tax=Pseudorhodoplanes sp. TaxID=1934341 RepID=UPI00391B82F8
MMASALPVRAVSAEPIPLVDLKAQYARHRPELDEAVQRVAANTSFIGGAEHEAFAREFAAWCGDGHVALVGNGTDALELAVIELLGEGDGKGEIVTTSHTFIATAESIANAGYRPVFCDIDEGTCLTPPDAIERAITANTRAIMPVHLYGQMADMPAIRAIADRYGLKVIEDAAQAHGAVFDGIGVGELGDAACFSFFPGKNLGAWGDAGAVYARDKALIERINRRANHGRTDKYLHDYQGVSSRLDTLQAAILRVKLRHIDDWNRARRQVASWYDELLSGQNGVALPVTDPRATSVFHLYVVKIDDRDRVRETLNAAGIGAGVHYPVPVHEQPAFRHLGHAPGDFPVTSRVARRVLSLPIYPEITRAQVERVAAALIDAVRA